MYFQMGHSFLYLITVENLGYKIQHGNNLKKLSWICVARYTHISAYRVATQIKCTPIVLPRSNDKPLLEANYFLKCPEYI